MTLAKAFVTGVVVKAPEKRFTQNDTAIAALTINIDSNAEALLRVIAFGQLADTIASNISVGDSIAVEGKLQTNTYKLPNGKDKKIFEISASSVEKMAAGAQNASAVASNSENIVNFDNDEIAQDLIDEDEIPF